MPSGGARRGVAIAREAAISLPGRVANAGSAGSSNTSRPNTSASVRLMVTSCTSGGRLVGRGATDTCARLIMSATLRVVSIRFGMLRISSQETHLGVQPLSTAVEVIALLPATL